MNMSKKLREAAWVLCQEWAGDCSDAAILDAVRANRVRREQVYRAMEGFGFRWHAGSWRRQIPLWLRNLAE